MILLFFCLLTFDFCANIINFMENNNMRDYVNG